MHCHGKGSAHFMNNESMGIDEFIPEFENKILRRYKYYVDMANNSLCKTKNTSVYTLDHDAFNINFSALKEAIYQIKLDLKILSLRRGDLIGEMRMSEGKIAGIVVYRLIKALIINIHRKCNACQHKCLSRLNNLIAVRIGLEYIQIKYTELPHGIRNEIIFTIKHRHINQEILGLVFDSLKGDQL